MATYVNLTVKTGTRTLLTAITFTTSLLLTTVAPAAPEVQTMGSVSFVSGGVGEDEVQEIKSLVRDYPLELMFVTKAPRNRYLSGVKVEIKDKDGKTVLDTESRGPYLLAKMPPGRYTISAASQGISKRQTVQIAQGKSQRAVFVWDLPTD